MSVAMRINFNATDLCSAASDTSFFILLLFSKNTSVHFVFAFLMFAFIKVGYKLWTRFVCATKAHKAVH